MKKMYNKCILRIIFSSKHLQDKAKNEMVCFDSMTPYCFIKKDRRRTQTVHLRSIPKTK